MVCRDGIEGFKGQAKDDEMTGRVDGAIDANRLIALLAMGRVRAMMWGGGGWQRPRRTSWMPFRHLWREGEGLSSRSVAVVSRRQDMRESGGRVGDGGREKH